MSGTTPQSDLRSTIERLNKMNSKNKGKNSTTTTTKSTIKYFKAKPGKNNVILLPTTETGDPFLEWGTHKNLLGESWKDIACAKHNKGQECLVCQVVDDLKAQNWKGNFNIWKPLETKIRYYSPVIDLDNIAEGLQWWNYGKSVLTQFETWLLNLEGDEKPFYNVDTPEKIIITYNKDAAPMDQYKLDKKTLKPFATSQVEEWSSGIKPLKELLTYETPQDRLLQLLDSYMERVKGQVDATDAEASGEEKEAGEKQVAKPVKKRLDELKG